MDINTAISLYNPVYADNPNLESYVELSLVSLNPSWFGDKFVYAQALFICHTIALGERLADESGAVVSKREGDLSVSYANHDTSNYSLTTYGKQLQSMIRSSGFALRGTV